MKNIEYASVFLLAVILLYSSTVAAYDDQVTHPKLTEISTMTSSLDSYLKSNFASEFASGLKTAINGKKVVDWLTQGSQSEDHPMCRASNHFHDPTTPWLESQMSDSPWMVYLCGGPRYSTVTWATGYDAPPPLSKKIAVVSPFYSRLSWDTARDYYYKALTLDNPTDREKKFANTFEAVGHVMHLLQDMAVPAHVRNDMQAHLFTNSSSWLPYNRFENYIKGYFTGYISSITGLTLDDYKKDTLTAFWDQNIYDGNNPSFGSSQGLSEFTNANYLSDFTVPGNAPTSNHTFPYPKLESGYTTVCAEYAPGATYMRYYVSRMPCPPQNPAINGTVDHFARVSILTDPDWGVTSNFPNGKYWIDDSVHATYAQELLPRAVGYSTALLDYFFRGKLEVKRVPGGMKVKNASNEEMTWYLDTATNQTIGKISVYYDDAANVRYLLGSYVLSTPLLADSEVTIPITDATQASRFIVVFKGKLGNEEGAVVGKILLAPLYYVKKVNGQDKIYMLDNMLENAGDNGVLVYENDAYDGIGKMAVSPNGNTLAFSAYVGGATVIKLLDLSSLPSTSVTTLTSGNWPTWSPDGKKIAFSKLVGTDQVIGEDWEIFTINIATLAETQLTASSWGNSSKEPAWSPDGTKIAYSRFAQVNCGAYWPINVMDTAGNLLDTLACPSAAESSFPAAGREATWSPNGQEIAFTRITQMCIIGQGTNTCLPMPKQLFKVNVSTKSVVKLTDSPVDASYDEASPAWSPDGTTVSVTSFKSGNADIYTVDPNVPNGPYKQNLTSTNIEADKYPAYGR